MLDVVTCQGFIFRKPLKVATSLFSAVIYIGALGLGVTAPLVALAEPLESISDLSLTSSLTPSLASFSIPSPSSRPSSSPSSTLSSTPALEREGANAWSQAGLASFAKSLQLEYRVHKNSAVGGCQLAGGIIHDSVSMTASAHAPAVSAGSKPVPSVEPGQLSYTDRPALPKVPSPCFEASLSLKLQQTSSASQFSGQWQIYFSQPDALLGFTSTEFILEQINGDLHRLTPNENYAGFLDIKTKRVYAVWSDLNLSEAKMMPNYFVVSGDLKPEIINSTRIRKDPETGLDVYPYVVPIPEPILYSSKDDKSLMATAARVYASNLQVVNTDKNDFNPHRIIPKPASTSTSQGHIDIGFGLSLRHEGIALEEVQFAVQRLSELGVVWRSKNDLERNNDNKPKSPLSLTVKIEPENFKPSASLEAYRLDISDAGIEIVAAAKAGVFYGLHSLAGLIDLGSTRLPRVTIVDEPRYPFRGLHIDVARNFHSKELILKLLDQMAVYKLNKLHLHMGDDEGWRLQIPGLPELSSIASKRCFDLAENRCLLPQLGSGPSGTSSVDGYFSVDDYIEIIGAAKSRYIQVIPAFDMPGHSRAAIKAMEARYRRLMRLGDTAGASQYLLSDLADKSDYSSIQYYNDNTLNPCMPSSFKFVEKVIDELIIMHKTAGQPLETYHIGADETAGAWAGSPICESFLSSNTQGVESVEGLSAYFIERVAKLLSEKGLKTAAWSDGLSRVNPQNMPANVQTNIWDVLAWAGVDETYKQLARGWDVVLSTPDALYFDLPYEIHPKEGGYYWASRKVNTQKVFNFMPGNLPALAQVYVGPDGEKFDISHSIPSSPPVDWHGIQAQLWSETIRSDSAVEYMLFPRLLAFAERAWHKPDWEPPYGLVEQSKQESVAGLNADMLAERDLDWREFSNTMVRKELPKLNRKNVFYRLPTVGAIVDKGKLIANVALPGLQIEYKIGSQAWLNYSEPVAVNGEKILVRSYIVGHRRRGRSIKVVY